MKRKREGTKRQRKSEVDRGKSWKGEKRGKREEKYVGERARERERERERESNRLKEV